MPNNPTTSRVYLLFFLAFYSIHFNAQTIKVSSDYYRDSIVSLSTWYGKNKSIDSIKSYYKSGQLDEAFYFKNGQIHGEAYKYSKEGDLLTLWKFSNGDLIRRKDIKIDYSYMRKDKMDSNIEKLKKINKEFNSKSFVDIYKRAYCRLQAKNYILAVKDYKFLLKNVMRNPKIPPRAKRDIHQGLGFIYNHFEQDVRAMHFKKLVLDFDNTDTTEVYNFAAYLYEIKSYRLSISYLNQVLEVWPNHGFSHWLLSAIYMELEDFDKAYFHINKAYAKKEHILKRNFYKNDFSLETIKGYVNYKQGNTDLGIDNLEAAIKIKESNSVAYRYLGIIHYEIENFDKACKLFKRADELGYEKVHDRNDLAPYLEAACSNSKNISPKNNIAQRPYIYPNPAVNVVQIKNLNQKEFFFKIYNYESKMVSEGNVKDGKIDFSNLKPGVYILKILTSNSLYNFKIIRK
ncbi:hypothetical protein KH5_19330 [Urechidicola sp. KH5]